MAPRLLLSIQAFSHAKSAGTVRDSLAEALTDFPRPAQLKRLASNDQEARTN
jgi:hypothetical protein